MSKTITEYSIRLSNGNQTVPDTDRDGTFERLESQYDWDPSAIVVERTISAWVPAVRAPQGRPLWLTIASPFDPEPLSSKLPYISWPAPEEDIVELLETMYTGGSLEQREKQARKLIIGVRAMHERGDFNRSALVAGRIVMLRTGHPREV